MANILVVEDDSSMNDVLVSILSEDGHEVQSAFTGPHAVELCQKFEFDLVITDVRLPGMDGVETLAQMRKLQPKLKCIVITGYASADTPVRAIRLKVDDYLFKPFSLKYFIQTVNRTLDRSGEAAQKKALFRRIFSMFDKSNDKALESMVLARQGAFRGLYVGTRSGYLSLKAAAEIYIKLEVTEDEFRGLLNASDPRLNNIKEIQEVYSSISERMELFQQGVASEAVNEGILPAKQFKHFYEAIKNSEIGLDDIMYAPLLRKTPDERFETLGNLLELKKRVWPEA